MKILDFIEYGSKSTYRIAFLIVLFLISGEPFECTIANILQNEYKLKNKFPNTNENIQLDLSSLMQTRYNI